MNGVITAYLIGCILQNILAVKTFAIGTLSVTTGGSLISWAVFACMDLITETKGKRFAVKVITIGTAANLLWNLLCQIAIHIPGNNQFIDDCYATVLGTGWRIAIASAVAFWLGNYVNTHVMAKMHERDGEKRFCTRAILSTVCGQIVDNALFYCLAFFPIGIPGTVEMSTIQILQVVLATTAIETIIESCTTPFTKRVIRRFAS